MFAHPGSPLSTRTYSQTEWVQDVNGPCPLLAIANVLLLRNQIQLPPGVGEVSQVRRALGCCGFLPLTHRFCAAQAGASRASHSPHNMFMCSPVLQARLVEMVAGYLLDANNMEGQRSAALSEEQRASLAHNLRCWAGGRRDNRCSPRMATDAALGWAPVHDREAARWPGLALGAPALAAS